MLSSSPNPMTYTMKPVRLVALTSLAMAAFAGNSLLCRVALRGSEIDPATFTSVRIVSGAIILWALVQRRGAGPLAPGSTWLSALELFTYAAAFSFAYLHLPVGAGALILFAAVQATMIGAGVCRGERLRARQLFGLTVAFAGLVLLLFPGLAAPPLGGSILMLAAGVAWGFYSLRGKGVAHPVAATAGNFMRAVPLALLLAAASLPWLRVTSVGLTCAIASGAVTSGLGYVIWYKVLPSLTATSAATVQLSAPVLAAIGGVLLLSEPITLRLVVSSVAVLGGIAIVIVRRGRIP